MMKSVKTVLRDLLPKKHQVPFKYWYGRIRGGLEAEMGFLKSLVKPGDRVIDVGGNRGVYAYQLWKLGTRVEVFEPNPICFSVLSAWAADKPAVHLHAEALSDHAGSASLHIPVDGAGVEHDASASLEHADFPHSRDQPVHLRTLDSFQMNDVSLIKIDVEGHEYSVIGGSSATIEACRPALLVEIEQRHSARPVNEIFDRIRAFDYEGFFVESGRLTALERFDLARHQSIASFGSQSGTYINNFVFLHRVRLERGEYASLVAEAVK